MYIKLQPFHAAYPLILSSLMACNTPFGEGEGGCAMSFFGCSESKTLTYETTVVDQATGDPLQGIQVRCAGEDEIQTTSNTSGEIAFTPETTFSPGCKYERCSNLEFVDPSGSYTDASATAFQTDDVEMAR